VTVYLLPDIEAKAREIGAGNVSGGLSKAVKAYRHTDRNGVAKGEKR
jgi:hypothetical protein